ncbi:MAG: pyruvate dehydrogenase complex dihydrolipoamide acetyltransferase [Xanthobacteraceae bacterium]
MPTNILMPALSPTMEKGNLAKWLKKEGDKVQSGDVIAEIETDKATMEVEAVDEGTIAKIVVPEGTADVPVNDVIAILATEGEDVKAAAAGGGAAPAPKAQPAPAAKAEAQPSAPAAPSPAAQPAAAAPATQPSGDRIFSTPLARRLAKEAGIELSRIDGRGPHGRVIARDVEAAKSGQGLKAPAAAAPAPQAAPPAVAPSMSDQQVRALFPDGSYEVVPHDNMRRVIAQRLTQSVQTIPHFYLTMDCQIDALLVLREQANAAAPKDKDGKPAYKLSVNDFVVKALALALQRVPDANVSWTDAGMLKHKHSDVGVAVAMPNGLITPIIRQAEALGLSVISDRMKDFAARARARKLKPEEYQGGTTAVSNLGMYGIKDFTAVINPPHATILAVGAGEQRAVVRDGNVVAATVMSVTLSCDHRAVDGALGAELIGAFKQLIENPMTMLV